MTPDSPHSHYRCSPPSLLQPGQGEGAQHLTPAWVGGTASLLLPRPSQAEMAALWSCLLYMALWSLEGVGKHCVCVAYYPGPISRWDCVIGVMGPRPR